MPKESNLPNQYTDDYGYNQDGDTDNLTGGYDQSTDRVPTTDYGCFKQTSDNADTSLLKKQSICVPARNNVRSLSLPVTGARPMYGNVGRNTNVVLDEPVSSSVVFIRPPNYLGLSILTLCCFWPFGLVAIIYAIGSTNASDNMNITKARSDGQMAKNFCIAAIVCGVILYTVIGIIISHYAQVQYDR
ncbi:hypothetical protein SNE40_015932 [Patella caerulea]|uniref:Uncharacterized protein n=1 Tax=Patella caerulea TaxID=87958 RepID=A0AAN8J9X1_PATCE